MMVTLLFFMRVLPSYGTSETSPIDLDESNRLAALTHAIIKIVVFIAFYPFFVLGLDMKKTNFRFICHLKYRVYMKEMAAILRPIRHNLGLTV
mmetsp:Transcript_12220/g.13828  ORF Transcript_12220/g.13828 Transcript_12220/m.13828 type:complete len:93 (+) Transcript_12220:10-288(+)